MRLGKQRSVGRNVIIYYLFSVDSLALVIVALVKRWLDAGLSVSEILLLQGLFGLVMVIMEVPSGALSDNWSRKGTLLASGLFGIAGVVWYGQASSFLEFFLGEFLIGVALSLESGTSSAFVYDSLLEEGVEQRAQEVYSRYSLLAYSSMVVCLLAGSFIGEYNLFLPFLIAAGYQAFVFTSLFIFGHEPSQRRRVGLRSSMGRAAINLQSNKMIQLLLVLAFVTGLSLRLSFWTYQPTLLSQGFSLSVVGLVMALLNLCAALTAYWVGQSKKTLGLLISGFLGASFLSLALLSFTDSLWLLLVGMMLSQVPRGGMSIVSQTILQSQVQSEERATQMSLQSAFVSLSYLLSTLIIRFIEPSIQGINQIALGLMIVSLGVLVVLRDKPSSPSRKEGVVESGISPN